MVVPPAYWRKKPSKVRVTDRGQSLWRLFCCRRRAAFRSANQIMSATKELGPPQRSATRHFSPHPEVG